MNSIVKNCYFKMSQKKLNILIQQNLFSKIIFFKLVSKRTAKNLLKCVSNSRRRIIPRIPWEPSGLHHSINGAKKRGCMSDFPAICPYAYAYVFWRKSLLMEELYCGFLKNQSHNLVKISSVHDLIQQGRDVKKSVFLPGKKSLK